MHPVPSLMTLAFDVYPKSRHFQHPHPPILVGKPISGLNCSSLSLQPVDWFASLVGADQVSPSQPRLLLPGFRRLDHSHRRRIWLQWQLGKFHRRDLHPLEQQLASLQPYAKLDVQRCNDVRGLNMSHRSECLSGERKDPGCNFNAARPDKESAPQCSPERQLCQSNKSGVLCQLIGGRGIGLLVVPRKKLVESASQCDGHVEDPSPTVQTSYA